MKIAFLDKWGIRERLITIAVVPATLMFVVISFALYFTGRDEVRSDINERGNLLASALAESSQYALVSGNAASLNETLRGLLAADRSLIAVEILAADSKPMVVVGNPHATLSEMQIFERPIRAQVPDVDLFDKTSGPHISAPTGQSAQFREGEALGHIRLAMSAVPILEGKRKRVYLSLAVVLLATLVSGVAGLYLARRLRDPLTSVLTAVRGIREGNYEVRLESRDAGELGELQAAIGEMAKSLSTARQELENKVAIRTSELRNAVSLASQADEERRRLIAQGNVVIEEERRRIAMEIHDHLNASLLFVKLEAQRIENLALKLAPRSDAAEIKEVAERISQTTAGIYDAARRIIKELRPEVIDILGLEGALREMVRTYQLAHEECRFDLRAAPDVQNLNPQLTITAYRVIQEALSNILKHAKATHASVSISPNRKRDGVCITIEDDGVGFNAKQRAVSGVGLIGMRERVNGIGGTIKITSAEGVGTKISIELPT